MTFPTKKTAYRPKITFALVAFNQEKYIEEAIDGALSQDYRPLEIIISDDCSTDSTYKKISSMTKKYNEGANLKALQTRTNSGLMANLDFISKHAKGEIIVLAAGDDISRAHRSSVLAEIFINNPKVFAVHSAYKTISDRGLELSTVKLDKEEYRDPTDLELLYNGGGVGLGATYAYRKECFHWPITLPHNLINEDRILPWRANLLGKIAYSYDDLVKYRLSIKGLSRNESLPRWPARKNVTHLNHLIKETQLALQLGKINKRDCAIYVKLLENLAAHMYTIDKIQARAGILSKPASWIYQHSFISRYKLKKILPFK
jgi:glycosyltransferase involved in cell wall biosynthesis